MNKIMWIVPAIFGGLAVYSWATHDHYTAWGGFIMTAIITAMAVYGIQIPPRMKWFRVTWECSQGIEHTTDIAAWSWRQAREQLLDIHDDVKDIIKDEFCNAELLALSLT